MKYEIYNKKSDGSWIRKVYPPTEEWKESRHYVDVARDLTIPPMGRSAIKIRADVFQCIPDTPPAFAELTAKIGDKTIRGRVSRVMLPGTHRRLVAWARRRVAPLAGEHIKKIVIDVR